jgi:hypothetical protein
VGEALLEWRRKPPDLQHQTLANAHWLSGLIMKCLRERGDTVGQKPHDSS